MITIIECDTDDTTNSSFLKRENYGAVYEPTNGILHGAGQDYDSFIEYTILTGNQLYPKVYMDYVGLVRPVEEVSNWGEHLLMRLENLPEDIIPQIGVNLTSGKDDGSGEDVGLANGKYDAQIEAFCVAIKKLDRPSFIRIGYEFEGSWNGYLPESYKTTFIKITRLLRNKNAKAATVWCSAGGSGGFQSWDSLSMYYPGDQWVDWWGVDIFSPEELKDARLITFLEKASDHRKPVMIGETTPRYVGTEEGAKSWDLWFDPFFYLMKTQPQIKAFCYINWDWDYWSDTLGYDWHDWKDARLQKNDIVKNRYMLELNDPIFKHSEIGK